MGLRELDIDWLRMGGIQLQSGAFFFFLEAAYCYESVHRLAFPYVRWALLLQRF